VLRSATGGLKGGLDIPAAHARCDSLHNRQPESVADASRSITRWSSRNLCIACDRSSNNDRIPVLHQPDQRGPGRSAVSHVGVVGRFLTPQFRVGHEWPGVLTASDHIERLSEVMPPSRTHPNSIPIWSRSPTPRILFTADASRSSRPVNSLNRAATSSWPIGVRCDFASPSRPLIETLSTPRGHAQDSPGTPCSNCWPC
jgi:hypothetical protein